MNKFKSGNIVKNQYGNILIIVGYRTVNPSPINTKGELYEVVDWVSAQYSNVSGSTRVEPKDEKQWCNECSCCPDEECDLCGGKKEYIKHDPGITEWKLLGDCMVSYITEKMLKNFDF